MSRTVVVVRVAPLPIRSDRLDELRRIFGAAVHVIETSAADPSTVEQLAATVGANAVIIDVVAPSVLAELLAALGSRMVLRPVIEHISTSRGERQPIFSGYARHTRTGELEPLADGELTPD